jgi:hypothetical protein
MRNTTPHLITNTASKQPTTINRHPQPRQTADADPPAVQDRARVGRFDDGMSTYPDGDRARVGRFDDGMSTYPDGDRARVGRFDDGMSSTLDNGQTAIGSVDDANADDALAA